MSTKRDIKVEEKRDENYRTGDRVLIDLRKGDGMVDSKFHGLVGMVTKVQEEGAGVAESVGDPFYTIQFGGGVSDGFWKEELTLVSPRTRLSKVPQYYKGPDDLRDLEDMICIVGACNVT